MPLVDRGRHQIHFESIGDPARPPVLLIMGLALSSRAWDRLPQLLARDFHVLVFDNVGTGKSGRRGFAYRMRDLADDAASVIEASGAQAAHVFGISMGGMVAQELAILHPERVQTLALGCTFASWRKGTSPSLGTKLDLLLLNLGFVTPARISRILVSAEWHAAHPESALRWLERAERTALRFATAQVLAVARHDTLDRLARIRAPTLVLTGSADKLVPPVNSEVLARNIPGARLVLLRGAGHVFPLEREAETVDALREHFLGAAARKRPDSTLP
ncbi:MAG: hypothetical protein AUH38_03070 [Deltaproteobacteria bacterium 13_1_40CM_68_24]|nr:MAG: hypothetical protein AUH38_03070 [Deltaproteobacteria bacterium 13_1_40CM_68_24]OLC71539.1 MAG: hypothetical protein AUH83_15530 [Deltaproteobacteria bacterium 13_1_40CM_4_68_19]OLD46984.1 MAG: hypothetical protein AUI48_05680 [Chloroflexi bacterium 13_1_40CM_2_68_14]